MHLLRLFSRLRTHQPTPNRPSTTMWSFMGAGSDQASLVTLLEKTGRLTSARVAACMRKVDRKCFCPPGASVEHIYMDSPMGIGWSQTISAPHMHAFALEMLEPALLDGPPGPKCVLDVGSGSGYLSAALALLAPAGSTVLGCDKHARLVERSKESIRAALPADVAARITLRTENVLAPGALEGEGPFDAIHVGAAAATVPASLVSALAPGGRLVIPVGPDVATDAAGEGQVLKIIDKAGDGRSITTRDALGVRFVPLTRPGADLEGGL